MSINHKFFVLTKHGLNIIMIPDNLIQADDYKLIRLDRTSLNLQGFTKRGGGIAVYIKNCVQFEALTEPLFQGSTEDLEFMTIKIIRKCTKPLYLINLYRPPTGDLENMYTSLSQFLSSLDNIDNATVYHTNNFSIYIRIIPKLKFTL